MTYSIISTSQAPDAKPIGLSVALTTNWETIIDIPSFEVPELVFGGDTIVVPGVGEIISPMIITNIETQTVDVSVRIYRASSNTTFIIANELPVPAFDVLPLPLNGQFIYTGDTVDVKASMNGAANITISYTVGQAEQDDVA
jgi:hypothetical protein